MTYVTRCHQKLRALAALSSLECLPYSRLLASVDRDGDTGEHEHPLHSVCRHCAALDDPRQRRRVIPVRPATLRIPPPGANEIVRVPAYAHVVVLTYMLLEVDLDGRR